MLAIILEKKHPNLLGLVAQKIPHSSKKRPKISPQM
jgi:hypothetical protein